MTEVNLKRIAVLPWPEMENCFLCLSGQSKKVSRQGDRWYSAVHQEFIQTYPPSFDPKTKAAITFAYRGKTVSAEWDGEYGPIQLSFKCEENYKSEDGYDVAKKHWLFDFAYGNGHWSQMAVEENNLPESFLTGDYQHIFEVLKKFVISRENPIDESVNNG